MRCFAGILFVSLAILSAPSGLTADDKVRPPDYLPLKEGTKWHYEVDIGGQKTKLVIQVAKIESIDGRLLARLEAALTPGSTASEHLSNSPQGIFRHDFNGMKVSPPVCLLKYPVKNGASWESEHKFGDQTVKMACRVGTEEVEVPAGKYKAVTVQVDAELVGMKVTTKYWFAAGVGIAKQIVEVAGQKVTMVLEKVERGN